MALQKQPLNINFAQGLDTKTDPFQVSPGRFLALSNSIFDKAGRLTKRNGFGALPPVSDVTFLTTFTGDLTSIGTSLFALSLGSSSWINKGKIIPIELETLALYRSSKNQSQVDSTLSPNNLICTVFTDSGPSYKYAITDALTGQNVVPATVIPVSSGTVTGSPRVFTLGRYFIIVITNIITATPHLQYIPINAYSLVVGSEVDLSTSYTPDTRVNFDGFVANNSLYLAWNGSDLGGAVRLTFLNSNLAQGNTVVFATQVANIMSVTADLTISTPTIYATYFDATAVTVKTLAVDQNLNTVLSPSLIDSAENIANIATSASGGSARIYLERPFTYTYNSVPTDFIKSGTITSGGGFSGLTNLVRSVGLASKAFVVNGISYVLVVYSSPTQPTYFLIDQAGTTVSKLAYANGGGYYTTGLPSVTLTASNVANIAYLIKDLLVSVNKSMSGADSSGIFSQTGLNLATFTITESNISTAEIGKNLNITGGFLWAYDGYQVTEQGFHLWPDNVVVTTSGAGGSITAQQYFYQVTYEWTDNQGNLFRSAPSVPVSVTTTGATSSNTVNVPTLRLTQKTNAANMVSIVIYRWSTAQQVFYQITSITSPISNNVGIDSIAYVDTLADSAILGNTILYTTGGVIENIAAPASSIMTLFNNRLFLVDAEDPNLLWYSKQVIESTPVEMSDLLTIFVAPTAGAQGSTGPITALSAMDDKLIIFKENAIYYINGIGPDNTGANSSYSDAIFVASTVGCVLTHSIVFTPNGLMFQSDKGIWLLGRDLSTTYIGAPVENFTTGAVVLSSENIPGTNQVRFTMNSGVKLMYDYYFGQWGTFTNVPGISSTLYQDLETYLDSFGRVFQETPGKYTDNSLPVLMSFTSSWMNLAGLQGYERFYQMLLLGQYLSPFKLSVQIAYDYNSSAQQSTIVTNGNSGPLYGGDPIYGDNPLYGNSDAVFRARIFPQIQKCESFQISVSEMFDSSVGQSPGAGLTLSGMNLLIGVKKGARTQSAGRSFG